MRTNVLTEFRVCAGLVIVVAVVFVVVPQTLDVALIPDLETLWLALVPALMEDLSFGAAIGMLASPANSTPVIISSRLHSG